MSENKKEKTVKVELKLRKRHPKRKMRLGSHVVTDKFSSFELNEAEQAELESKGGKAWFIEKKEAEKKKVEPAKK